jgi:hypothetical protein
MTNSSRSVGWLQKTNFREVIGKDTDLVQAKVHIKMVQHHATLFLFARIKEYSQWFMGQESNIAGALLQDFDRSEHKLTQSLCELAPFSFHSIFK